MQVVITGGENEFITRVATNLWLLGANVLLTFTYVVVIRYQMLQLRCCIEEAVAIVVCVLL